MQNFDVLELAELRVDGRRYLELRPMQHRIGLLSYADGSAYLEQGLNKVLVIVNGPQEPRKRDSAMPDKVSTLQHLDYFYASNEYCLNVLHSVLSQHV